jgi:transposase, IS6 family
LDRESARCSACPRHTLTLRNEVSPSRYANNHIEADHGRLKSRLDPMRGLKQDRSARVVIGGHGFVQNLRRGHYELAVEELVARRLAGAFDELALVV